MNADTQKNERLNRERAELSTSQSRISSDIEQYRKEEREAVDTIRRELEQKKKDLETAAARDIERAEQRTEQHIREKESELKRIEAKVHDIDRTLTG